MKIFTTIIALLLAVNLFGASADEIMKKSHLNYYYSGDDGKADVTMTLVSGDTKKEKRFSMVRKDLEDGGDQNYFIYFKKPSDIKKMTFIVKKYQDKPDDRMLYVPAIDLVKKIAASDKASSFVGSDFSYEDVSGRLWSLDNHTLVEETKLEGKDVFKIKSTPKEKDYFSHKISYISKADHLPLKEEFFDTNGENFKTFTIEKMETIEGIPTATVRRMLNVEKDQYTDIVFNKIDYNIGIKNKYFKERYLKKPHKSLK